MAEIEAEKFQALDIEDTHGDEGVILASPPSTYENEDDSHSKEMSSYSLPSPSPDEDLSPSQSDRLLAEQEYEQYESRISPLSPDGRKKYGINARNDSYRPGGGNVRIFSEKIDFKSVGSRIDARSKSPRKSPPSSIQSPVRQLSKSAPTHSSMSPSPGARSIRSKVGSLDNARHTPGGGNTSSKAGSSRHSKKTSKDSTKKKKKIRIVNRKEKYDTVQSRIGSKDNITHKPGGGNIKIENKRLSFLETAKPKVGSLDKVDHRPGGGDKRIMDEKVEWSAQSKVGSKDNITHKPGGGDKRIEEQKLEWKVEAKVGSKDNLKHSPGGGAIKIESKITEGKDVKPLGNEDHQAVGGTMSPPSAQIESRKLDFKDKAQPKIGSLDYQPAGEYVQVEGQRLTHKENAEPCTDNGVDMS